MRTFRCVLACHALMLLVPHAPASAQTQVRPLIDHIHLSVPDRAEAVAWYQRHFGGETMTEGPYRLLVGETRLIFSDG